METMEDIRQSGEVLDLRVLFRNLLQKKWKVMGIVLASGVLASILIVLVPRTYATKVVLAPETESVSAGGMLSSIGASFGIDLGALQSNDAIYPLLYPDLIESNDFIVSLFGIVVETGDGSLRTSYYDYLDRYQAHAPWEPVISGIKRLLRHKSGKKVLVRENPSGYAGPNPFMLTDRENKIAKLVKENVVCSVDRKTDVITISVSDQDPYICATMADSIRLRLQNFIIAYRTEKSRADMEYYAGLAEEARVEYEEAMKKYSDYSDSHQNITLQSFMSEKDRLENDMQLKFNTYSAMSTQYQATKAKVQERTPAFTILQNAYVPNKADKPKRMLFVIGVMFLVFVCTVFYYLKDDIFVSESQSELTLPEQNA